MSETLSSFLTRLSSLSLPQEAAFRKGQDKALSQQHTQVLAILRALCSPFTTAGGGELADSKIGMSGELTLPVCSGTGDGEGSSAEGCHAPQRCRLQHNDHF